MRATLLLWMLSLCLCGSLVSAAEPAKMLELHVGKSKFTGKILARSQEDIWILERDGRVATFAISDVTDFKPLSGAFRALSAREIRDQLQKEFGRGYEVAGSSHYLVVGGKGQPKRFVAVFEELYRHLHVYLSARNFRIREPEFPLVAVVFPDRAAFVDYCLKEKVRPSAGLRGYYLQNSNRVALYDSSDAGDVDATIIHEAVHQVAFNLGLHRRMGDNPQWVVEGLATTLEPDGFRNSHATTPLTSKINQGRYVHFRNYLAERRPAKSLEEFVQSDQLFKSATLDGYSQAWALTFFLLETRQEQYGQYLKLIMARPPLEVYEPDQRLADFQKAFGKNVAALEMDFVRFMSRLGN